jgi:ribosomal protein L25 (general stress protein Ctc)
LVFDTSVYPDGKLPERVFFDDKGNSLRVIVEHAPLKSNYSHCDLNAYLTTIDGKFDDSLVKPEDYNRHPLKKQLRQLRNDYRNELAYWFQFEDEEDGEEDVIEVRLEPPSSGQ